MTSSIIARKKEMITLNEIYSRKDSDFLAIYGRRRVGKTYLIRNFFKKVPSIYFESTGLKDGTLRNQLKLFIEKVNETFSAKITDMPENWLEALQLLTNCISKIPVKEKIILFFDELPWLSSPKSGFIQALDYFWNTTWSTRQNLKLIVCGSAASWMLNKLIRAKGGLHNRLTAVINLKPFTLRETEDYLKYRGIRLNRRQILELYMTIGGIPYYLKGIQKNDSPAQTINKICFNKDGFLFNEFRNLFASLFDNSSAHIELIRLIAHKRNGIDKETLLKKSKYSSSGGRFNERLNELEEAGFIAGFTPYKNQKKGKFYRIIDEYTLFYLHWIEPASEKLRLSLKSSNYWESKVQTPSWKSWSGYAFEAICFKHIEQIKKALSIQVIASEVGSWKHISLNKEKNGAQIDLLIDRADGIINLCEIKYCQGKFSLTKKIYEDIENKIQIFKTITNENKTILITLITPYGVVENKHALHLISSNVILDDLYEE